MTHAIRHRGPDADGAWLDADAGIALGHRRLAIIDLSEAGAQPMASANGRYVLAFNGEIYNFEELRAELDAQESRSWRGHSDTEVLLALIATKGLDATLPCLDGMFALTLWDRETRSLTLARDAFGEKPLYYGLAGGALVFGSELKALRRFPGFDATLDVDALASFFKYSYIPTPHSIFAAIAKLPAAHTLTVTMEDVNVGRLPDPTPWWDPVIAAQRALASAPTTMDQAVSATDAALRTSVRRRMMSDVPLGSLLSGGIDSTLTTAIMCELSDRPIRTFTIGMQASGFDEADHARAVARHLGTDHTELQLTAAQVQAVVPDMATIYDEPFADSSQVPTTLVSRMAREQVTVVLSGDGGDELFAGYNRHFRGAALWGRIGQTPAALRAAFAAFGKAVPPGMVDRVVASVGGLAPAELRAGRAGEKWAKLMRVAGTPDATTFHDRMLATADDVGDVLSPDLRPVVLAERAPSSDQLGFGARAMLADTTNYMPDDVLTKVDRASMAASLEVRTPYLSRDLFDLAWSLPMEVKMDANTGKKVLRELLYTKVPRAMVDRPKAGFAIPVGPWLREGLRDWAEDGLSKTRLTDAGIFDVDAVRRRWDEHLSGRRDHATFLWSVLMLQDWRRVWGDGTSAN